MKTNLTPNEIDRIVEALTDQLLGEEFTADQGRLVYSMIPDFRTALSTIELDRPKEIDLKEVERTLNELAYEKFCAPEDQYKIDFFLHVERSKIGYTLNDLKP